MAEELGLKCVTERREIAAGKYSGENTESAARRIRYDFLREVRDTEAPGGLIATGHTLDDQLPGARMVSSGRCWAPAGTTSVSG